MPRRTSVHYVDNKKLYAAMVEYIDKCRAAENQAIELGISEVKYPRVPDYVAKSIFDIARNIATKSNFSGYSFREDMIMDGVENCLKYIRNFNPDKYNNPYGYFTQIIYFAFFRRIGEEKKQLYVRYKQSAALLHQGGTFGGDEDLSVHLSASADYIDSFVEEYEEKMKGKKKIEEVDKTATEDNIG